MTNLYFSYNSNPFFVDMDFFAERGEIIGMIGPNGCGKTTLINLIRGYLSPDKGMIRIHGRNIEKMPRIEMGKMLSYVPQESRTSFNFTAYEIVSMGRYPYACFPSTNERGDHDIIMKALELTDAKELAYSSFWNLSGGEKQRVILARALAQQAAIILLDEPTSSLDLKQATNLYSVIRRINEIEKVTIVAATHDVALVQKYCHRLVMMKEGNIIASGSPDQLLREITPSSLYDLKEDQYDLPSRDK